MYALRLILNVKHPSPRIHVCSVGIRFAMTSNFSFPLPDEVGKWTGNSTRIDSCDES